MIEIEESLFPFWKGVVWAHIFFLIHALAHRSKNLKMVVVCDTRKAILRLVSRVRSVDFTCSTNNICESSILNTSEFGHYQIVDPFSG
jgi:hypothetical protein